MSVRAIAVLVLACALTSVSAARADEGTETARAAKEYDAGMRAFQDENFVEAARAFERADQVAAHPRARYNAALSWDHARDFPRAADAYASSIVIRGLDAERTEAARRRLDQLRRRLGAIDVRRPSGGKVSVAHVSGAAIPARIHVQPGTHKVELVAADGTKEERDIDVRVGERVVLEIAVTTVPLAPGPPAPTAAASPPPPAPAPDDRSRPSSARTTWGFVALGGAVAFGAGAVFFGVKTADSIDEFDQSGDRDSDARESAVRNRALAWTAAGASLACAAVGIVLLTTGGERAAHARSLELGAQRGGVSARLRF